MIKPASLRACLGLITILLTSQLASASSITTEAIAGALGNTCGYTDVTAVYDSASGAAFYPPSGGCDGTYTYSGSPNVLGLTSSFDATNVSNIGGLASSSVSASIDSGTIMASVSSSGNAVSSAVDGLNIYNLIFTNPNASPTTSTTVVLNLLVAGSLYSSASSSADYVLVSFNGVEVEWNGASSPYFASGTSAPPDMVVGCFTASCISLQESYTFTGSTGNWGLLSLDNNSFGCQSYASQTFDSCSENYTESLSISTPTGVSFTSDSPTFLTTAPTPEPGTLGTVAVAGLLIIFAGHRREQAKS